MCVVVLHACCSLNVILYLDMCLCFDHRVCYVIVRVWLFECDVVLAIMFVF